MTSELNPCPFCGGKIDPEGWISLYHKGPECEDCGAPAQRLMECYTSAVPDVPELKRYDKGDILLALEGGYDPLSSDDGEYVRYDQAAAIIAAKDKEIERLLGMLPDS